MVLYVAQSRKARHDARNVIKKTLLAGIILSLLVTISGCGLFCKKEDEWKPVKPKSPALVHTVQSSRETIQIISKWYTGDSTNWNAVADANPAITPYLLSVGDTVFVPSTLLKTRKPMPDEFVSAQYQKSIKPAPRKQEPKKPAPQPAPPEKEVDELELFGPK